jgi:fimbrial chaperone protein
MENSMDRRIVRRLVSTIVVALVSSVMLSAFQFSPMEQTFSPTGAGNTKTYTIVNDSEDTIAVQISALTRSHNINGEEVNAPADAYFSITPNKCLIPPQTSQVVRVQYRGTSTVTRELSFRIKAEQILYSKGKAADNQSMFNFLYIFSTSAYVEPSQKIERIALRKVAPSTKEVTVTDKDGKASQHLENTMAITISNLGTVHQKMINPTFAVMDSKGNKVLLSGDEATAGLSGSNILAGETVTLQIPWPIVLSRDSGTTYKFSNIKYGED